jgi:hypothetical protein
MAWMIINHVVECLAVVTPRMGDRMEIEEIGGDRMEVEGDWWRWMFQNGG